MHHQPSQDSRLDVSQEWHVLCGGDPMGFDVGKCPGMLALLEIANNFAKRIHAKDSNVGFGV
jgi:hypothetical protein